MMPDVMIFYLLFSSELKRRLKQEKKEREKAEKLVAAAAALESANEQTPKSKPAEDEEIDPNVGHMLNRTVAAGNVLFNDTLNVLSASLIKHFLPFYRNWIVLYSLYG